MISVIVALLCFVIVSHNNDAKVKVLAIALVVLACLFMYQCHLLKVLTNKRIEQGNSIFDEYGRLNFGHSEHGVILAPSIARQELATINS